MVLLASCGTTPPATPSLVIYALQTTVPPTPVVLTSTVTVFSAPTVTPPVSRIPPNAPTPTFISASLPDGLAVAYVVEDDLWIWKENSLRLLLQHPNLSDPLFSADGQWLLLKQRFISMDGSRPPSDELWVVQTDGSNLKRLVGSDDLMVQTGREVLIDEFNWVPGRHEILFNTEEIVEGPPGSLPLFDLYALDLSGHVTHLAEPGQGGRFTSSPDGVFVALTTSSRIEFLDLESGERRLSLEFEPLEFPSDGGPRTPRVVWDPQGQFVITSILPPKFYYSEYAGEPEQVWQLFVDGRVELITELQPPSQFATGISVAPNFQYFFYFKESCADGTGTLYVRSLTSPEEYPLSCLWGLPQWAPDSEHFIYKFESWRLGNIHTTSSQPLDFVNIPTNSDINAHVQWRWMNNEYFLLILGSRDMCTFSVATLQGVITEITRTPSNLCPTRLDFSLPE